MTEKLNYYVQLLKNVQERLTKAQDNAPDLLSDDILHQLEQVINSILEESDSGYALGQDWKVQMFTYLVQCCTAIERELFWFFGVECLHFLSDEGIVRLQQSDESAQEELIQSFVCRITLKTRLSNS